MTEPYDDGGRDPHLEERLHRLAGGVPVPMTPVTDDVRRGRRRLFRMRAAMAGGTVAALAAVLGVTGLTAGDPTATEISPVTQPTSTRLPSGPSTGPSAPATPESSSSDPQTSDDAGSSGAGTEGRGGQGGPAGSSSATSGAPEGTTSSNLGRGTSTKSPGRPENEPTHTATEPTEPVDPTESVDPTLPTSTPTTPTSPPTTGPTSPTTGPTSPTTGPTSPPTTTPTDPPTTTPPAPPTGTGRAAVTYALRTWNQVLAEHLDPDRDHLATFDAKTAERRTVRGGGQLYELGTHYDWTAKKTGEVDVTVATGWDQLDWKCGATYASWTCTDGGLSGVTRSEVASHDGVVEVAVQRTNGQVVVLSGPASTADLLEAAADTRLALPGTPFRAPASLDTDTFATAGTSALVVGSAETFVRSASDRAPSVRGTRYVSGASRGNLSWAAAPTYAGHRFSCLASHRSCESVQWNGLTVNVAKVKKKAGGGWMVQYDGPSYAVTVWSSDKTLPKKRAYAFVTQAVWQP
jgi:hypothetical protein